MKIKNSFYYCAIIFCCSAGAVNLQVTVVNQKQQVIENAVIYINKTTTDLIKDMVIVDQLDKEFIPYVTVVQKGSAVNFPNNDEIRHQVYSFSKAKQFEIPLYSGNTSEPIIFNNTGAIAMACNIHDWMTAYIYVVDTDKFAISDKSGKAIIENVPNGNYEILVWHPKLKGNVETTAQQVSILNQDKNLDFKITQKSMMKAWRAPRSVKRRGY